jgi:hypothetical protein
MINTINALTLLFAVMTGFGAVALLLLIAWFGCRKGRAANETRISPWWKRIAGKMLTFAGSEPQNGNRKRVTARKLQNDTMARKDVGSHGTRGDV